MIFLVRTTVGRENSVIEASSRRVKNMALGVKSIVNPSEVRGYVFFEGEIGEIERSISGVPHIRGMIKKEMKLDDIAKFLETKKAEVKVFKGDIVEVLGGPFKNERGKVTRVDESKEEVTIELLEAAIPIPITVSLESVRVLESAEKENK